MNEDIKDWHEFKAHITSDVDRQVTSNKALLWVGASVTSGIAIIALTIAVIATIMSMTMNRDLVALQKELSEFKSEVKYSVNTMENAATDAVRAYNNARKTKSRMSL